MLWLLGIIGFVALAYGVYVYVKVRQGKSAGATVDETVAAFKNEINRARKS